MPPTLYPFPSPEVARPRADGDPLDTGPERGLVEGEQAVRPATGRTGKAVREILETVLLALFIYLTVRTLVQNFKVEGSSMEPTLRNGEYLLVNKAAYASWNLGPLNGLLPAVAKDSGAVYPFGLPKVGDIVVFHYPKDPSRDFIKRVVAGPGDVIEIRAGVVYRNEEKLDEPYIKANPGYTRERITMPEGQFFVLGDNRANSSDSHVWGPVPFDKIVGKAWLTYWPLKSWGNVQDHSVFAHN
ncbi:MAG: signal peptidase I [Dehalococcoidia bacterium]|nr:signal peptidase I [Dehalococcoidia bacterium]